MPLDEAYFVWLYVQVGGSVDNKNLANTYWALLKILYTTRFTWPKKMERDGNRAQDGKDLRREFLNREGVALTDESWLDEDCSVLEMLVALAWKLEWESTTPQETWFWMLIDNLGLLECTDANPPEEDIVRHILDKMMRRQYAPNGAGGLFPLTDPDHDQRDIELWYQAQSYLLERI